MLLDLLPLFSPAPPGSGGGVGGGGRIIWPVQQPWPIPLPPLFESETDDDETALAVLGAL